MNPIAEEIDSLMHYGIPRRSGRYPYGSGEDPYQHGRDFLGRIEELKKSGWTETPENIHKEFGMTTSQYRSQKGIANNERRMLEVARAKSLKEDGLGYTEIGRQMGINESTVRSLLNERSEAKMNQAKKTADFLKQQVKEKGMIDVGVGVERELNVSREKLNQALKILDEEGYYTFGGRVDQATNPGKKTTIKVLCPPDTPYKVDEKGKKTSSAIYDFDKIKTVKEYVSHDDGETFDKYVPPKSLDSNRVKIRYAEEGGIEKDGIIELRRGAPDLSLGESRYAQVRILVDGKRYLKGVAVYSDDMPDGVDVIFNTNKKLGTDKMDVLKKVKDDPDNPFGALIKPGGQSYYIDKDGKRQLSPINKTREEGDWDDWSNGLPSQFLSKQNINLAKKQLNLAAADKMAEFDELNSLTNPTVKKYLLSSFAEDCDSAAVHLKAAALPGQKYHVIIPIPSMKDTEVYAPRYENGTKLALIRYPHGGTFEIPILTVNNKQADARKLLGADTFDAVGINSKVAERLSGADFDGDTVMCIPTHDRGGKVKITSTPPLDGLKGFDPKMAYPEVPGMKVMKNTQIEMGKISNLITDMTVRGATDDELAAAVRHSMVVIDAEKHHLNYKQSEFDNNISALKKKYQAYVDENGNVRYGGAATLLSRAKGQATVLKRQGTTKINMKGKEWYDPNKPEGSLIYKVADDLYYPVRKYDKTTNLTTVITDNGKKITYNAKNKKEADMYEPVKNVDEKTGKVTFTNKAGTITYRTEARTQKSTQMAETDDARSLISEGTAPIEIVYADYANKMKSLANQARKEIMTAGKIKYSATAKSTYQPEVDSLMAKLNTALLNSPRERQAQLLANAQVNAKKAANPDMSKADIKKESQRALSKYRTELGSVARRDRSIKVTDREWEAIQAGAISENVLMKILANTDADSLRQKATPRAMTTISTAQANRIKAMRASNYTLDEIAKKLGLSASTITKYAKGA